MTTTIAAGDISSFASAVRAELDDLPTDDVDELLDGLEGDLSDQAAEAGDAFALPDPAAYAAELRSAAGLPEREATESRPFRQRLDDADAAVARWFRSHPATQSIRDFLVALRPVWWLLRGWALYMIVIGFLPISDPLGMTGDVLARVISPTVNLVYFGLLLACVILSVQWGRGRWVPTRWLRGTRTALSVVTAIALPILVFSAIGQVSGAMSYIRSAGYENFTPGLAVDSERVRNIFAYDAQGNPIEQVQLFDQSGQPLTTVGPSGQTELMDPYFWGGGGPAPVAERENGRQPVWNVYPLREVAADAFLNREPDPREATTPTFPFAQVPTVAARDDEPTMQTPSPTVSPSPEPSAPTPPPTEMPSP